MSELLEFFTASQQIDVVSKLQSGRPPMGNNDSGMSVSFASSTTSPAKQSFSIEAGVSKPSALSFPGIY